MKHLYPFLKKSVLTCTALAVLGAARLNAQTAPSPCGPIVENFNGTGMGGFTSSTANSSAPGFTPGSTGQNGFLQRCNVPTGGVVYELTTPTYRTFANQTAVGYGFELSGAIKVSRVIVILQYIANDGSVVSVEVANFTPSYSGPNQNDIAAECRSVAISTFNGFDPGDSYRFTFQFTASSAGNNNQCITFDNFRTTGGAAAAALPVGFTGVRAARQGSSAVLVSWNVAGEYDVNRYEVERSTDGRTFTKIGEVAANGKNYYSFEDAQPLNGVALYRVRNVDEDGQFAFSKIVRYNNSRDVTLKVFPTPARNEITIEHNPVEGKGLISIASANGQIVKRADIRPDVNQTVVDVSNLQAGVYLIRFDDGSGKVQTLKLLKQ